MVWWGRWRRTLENTDSRGEVVDTPGSAESGSDDGRRGDEIVGEAVVKVSLRMSVRWPCTWQPTIQLLQRLSDDTGAYRIGRENVPEARRHRSPCQTPSRTWYKDTQVSDAAPRKLNGAQWLSRVGYTSSPCPTPQPLLRFIVPGGKLLECLLGMLVAFSDSRLGESALSVPRNGRGSVDRGSHAHSADLGRSAYKRHFVAQLASGKLRE
jgi:hypothetical protein